MAETKKTYRLTSGVFCTGIVDPCYCVLGVYAKEKHGFPDPTIFGAADVWSLLRDNQDDMRAMAEVIWNSDAAPGEMSPYISDSAASVYEPNDDGCPVVVLEEALKAVGVEVKLEDRRLPRKTPWTEKREAKE